MIRSAAIQAGNIIKQEIGTFNSSNLFILQEIPETILNQKIFPLIRIDALANVAADYVSDKKRFETVSCQVNLFVKTNQEMETLGTLIEQTLVANDFSCFYISSARNEEFAVQQMILRFYKNNDLKGVF